MEFFNSEKKKLRKKDLEAFYYDEKGNFTPVPSMASEKTKVLPFLKLCIKKSNPDIKDEDIDRQWELAESKRQAIFSALEQLKSESEAAGDTFKTAAYSRGLIALKKIRVPIVSGTQAQKISGIGKGIAGAIDEVIKEGTIKTAEERFEQGIKRQSVTEEFLKVWGATRAVANLWYNLGFRTIQDLSKAEKLSDTQALGLEHFEDFQLKIERKEFSLIFEKLAGVFKTIDADAKPKPRRKIELIGPARRGEAQIEEIEILITSDHQQGKKSFLRKFVDELESNGAGVVTAVASIGPAKFTGVCKLGKGYPFRKITIRYVQWDTWGVALIFSTGPSSFTKFLKEQAAQMGYVLKDKELTKISMEDDNDQYIPTPMEEDVFSTLTMAYVNPKDRV